MNKAPIELQSLGLNPHDFKFSDSKSWRGPCPVCGGHRRFVVFTDHPFPLWHGYCDECNTKVKMWEKVRIPYDPQKAAAIEAERAREEAERAEYRRRKLAEFSTTEIWAELRDRMTKKHIEWWENQGVPEDIQRYLSIGYVSIHAPHEGSDVYPFMASPLVSTKCTQQSTVDIRHTPIQ